MKALTTLRDLATPERVRILTSLAGRFLPNPLVEPDDLSLPTEGHEAVVLEEVLRNLRLSRSELTAANRPVILEELYTQTLSNALTEERVSAARQRLGMSGDLRPDLYKLEFPDSFSLFEQLGTRRAHVQAAISSPDKVQHLLPERIRPDDTAFVSLFLKRIESSGRDSFFLLIQTRRSQDTQIVGPSCRLYY
jgi:hypothetical protein